jgi:hypothetical protein
VIGTDARTIDPDTLGELPQGETGEIVSPGPQVFKEWRRHPDATRTVFIEIDGKPIFRTGDLGRIDEEGNFFITDRLKRMIKDSAFKVWPGEVELLLFKCPAVLEARIFATCDACRGESVKAGVVLPTEARGHTTPEDIIAWAREHMAGYKLPRSVVLVDALPKSRSGKLMWRLLQAQEPVACCCWPPCRVCQPERKTPIRSLPYRRFGVNREGASPSDDHFLTSAPLPISPALLAEAASALTSARALVEVGLVGAATAAPFSIVPALLAAAASALVSARVWSDVGLVAFCTEAPFSMVPDLLAEAASALTSARVFGAASCATATWAVNMAAARTDRVISDLFME